MDTEGGAKAEAKDQPIAEAVEGSASKERDEAKAAASPAPVVSKKEKVAAKTFALASSAIAVPKRSISLGSRRVPMWHKVRQCIVQGEGAPTVRTLSLYIYILSVLSPSLFLSLRRSPPPPSPPSLFRWKPPRKPPLTPSSVPFHIISSTTCIRFLASQHT